MWRENEPKFRQAYGKRWHLWRKKGHFGQRDESSTRCMVHFWVKLTASIGHLLSQCYSVLSRRLFPEQEERLTYLDYSASRFKNWPNRNHCLVTRLHEMLSWEHTYLVLKGPRLQHSIRENSISAQLPTPRTWTDLTVQYITVLRNLGQWRFFGSYKRSMRFGQHAPETKIIRLGAWVLIRSMKEGNQKRQPFSELTNSWKMARIKPLWASRNLKIYFSNKKGDLLSLYFW